MLPFVRQRGMMTNVAALMGGAAAPPSGFVSLGSNSVVGMSGTTLTCACTGTLAAGKVAVVAIGTYGQAVTNFRDNVDAATAWTSFGSVGAGSNKIHLFKRIVPAGGFDTSTVFTATYAATGSNSIIFAAGFLDATGIPTTNDSTVYPGNSTTINQTITGPTVGTSYQFAATVVSTTHSTGPDAGSTGGWTLDRNLDIANVSLRTYYRKATDTSSTTLKETEGSFAVTLIGWMEAAL